MATMKKSRTLRDLIRKRDGELEGRGELEGARLARKRLRRRERYGGCRRARDREGDSTASGETDSQIYAQ